MYTYICGNIINNNDDFNERTNTLLYKNIISHTLFSKGLMLKGEMGTGTDCYILTQVLLLTIAELISLLGWGYSTVGH